MRGLWAEQAGGQDHRTEYRACRQSCCGSRVMSGAVPAAAVSGLLTILQISLLGALMAVV